MTLIWPNSNDLRDVAMLLTAFNRGSEPRTSNVYYRYLGKKTKKNYLWLSPPLTSQILRDGVFEGLPPDAQFVRFEVR